MSEAACEAELEQVLQMLEWQLLQPAVRRNADALDQLLAEDFVEFGQSGRRYDKAAIVTMLANESTDAVSFALDGFKLQQLAADVALVTYALDRHEHGHVIRRSRRSSIWQRRQDRWQLVFHQGTAVPTEAH